MSNLYDPRPLKGISLFKGFPQKKADIIDLDKTDPNCCYKIIDKKSIELPPIKHLYCIDPETRECFIDKYYERSQYCNIFQWPKIFDGRIFYNDSLIHESMPPFSRKAQNNADLSNDYLLADYYQERYISFIDGLTQNNVLNLKGTFAFCFHALSNNYFHWHMQAVSVIWFLRRCKLGDQVKILLPNNISKWQIDALQYYGVKVDDIQFYPPNAVLNPEKLIYTSLSWLQFHNGWYEHPVDFIRSFRKSAGIDSKNNRMIYLSRSGQRRACTNESQFEAELSKLNVEVCSPEKLCYWEQVELFSSAKIIISPPGAALTNLVHAKPDTILIEIWSETAGKNGTNEISKWGRFARVLELNDYVYVSEPNEEDQVMQDASGYKALKSWTLNIDATVNFIKPIIANEGACI